MDETAFDPKRYQQRLYRDSPRKHRYSGQTGEQFTAWQDAFRDDLRRVLGHHAIPEHRSQDGDETIEQQKTETGSAYDRQTWVLRTEPGVHVPFHLLIPATADPPYPVVLTIHGHTDLGKELTVGVTSTEAHHRERHEQRRDTAIQAIRRGYAAIAPDMRAFGALADANEGRRACTAMQKTAQLYGRSLLGERVWDVLRLLDFVERQPILDADRIGITGHSGGGAVSLFAAALDDRLSPVAPNAYFCALGDSIIPIDHCACNYVPGMLRLGELWDIAGLIAPRPIVVATGEHDRIVPVEGTRRAFENLREIYAAIDAEDRCALHVGDGGHEYYPDGIWPFVRRHL